MSSPQKKPTQAVKVKAVDEETFLVIPHTMIEPNEDQPRKHFNEKTIDALSISMEEKEQQTPVLVTVRPRGTKYTIKGGENRWRAACLISKRQNGNPVPLKCVVVPYKGEAELFRGAFMDNVHRQEMEPLDVAASLQRLKDDGETIQGLADMYGKSTAFVNNYLKLNGLDSRVKELMDPAKGKKRLRVTHAIRIAKVTNKDTQFRIAQETLAQRLTTRDIDFAIESSSIGGNLPIRDNVFQFQGSKMGGTYVPIKSSRGAGKDYAVMRAFMGRTRLWLERATQRIGFDGLYDSRINADDDHASDLRQIKQLREGLTNLENMLVASKNGKISQKGENHESGN